MTPETKGLIGAGAIEKMKKGVMIVNAARGGIVDEEALVAGIAAGKVAGAALDVFTKEPLDPASPLLGRDEVIVTPHLGASTDEAQERVALEIAQQVAEYLTSGVIKNAVNVPALAPEVADKLEPYVRLARKIGSLLGQLEPVEVAQIRVTGSGEPGQLGLAPVSAAAVSGYLERYLDTPVNPVSAPFLAEERGITVSTVHEQGQRRHTNIVRVDVTGKGGTHSAAGTLGSDWAPRLAALDGFEVDAHLGGTTLVIRNEDRPGVIGSVGTVLGKKGINVSRKQVGLDDKTGRAVALWNVASGVDDDTLAALRRLEFVDGVLCVEL
jgi:D-3-phosphoglycerate dehydrogenase